MLNKPLITVATAVVAKLPKIFKLLVNVDVPLPIVTLFQFRVFVFMVVAALMFKVLPVVMTVPVV